MTSLIVRTNIENVNKIKITFDLSQLMFSQTNHCPILKLRFWGGSVDRAMVSAHVFVTWVFWHPRWIYYYYYIFLTKNLGKKKKKITRVNTQRRSVRKWAPAPPSMGWSPGFSIHRFLQKHIFTICSATELFKNKQNGRQPNQRKKYWGQTFSFFYFFLKKSRIGWSPNNFFIASLSIKQVIYKILIKI